MAQVRSLPPFSATVDMTEGWSALVLFCLPAAISGDLYSIAESAADARPPPPEDQFEVNTTQCRTELEIGQPNMSHAISLTNMEDSTQLFVKDMPHGYPLSVDYGKVPVEYTMSTVLPPQANGFQFISEVTNTLLGQ
ncbi:unnamed protein product [Heligmosomoides polygyrus]|uniref:CDHR5 n=1 Tax=Heligmosomoides polygyrus TaxID=6339 RepID=A0A183GU61_HELPZ|nr:unnamed protein product [Heligmosomoides polygyrus]